MANKKKSPITGFACEKAFIKGGVQYYRDGLGNIFSKPLDQSEMIGGGYEVERNNDAANETRLQRIKDITGKAKPTILDFGCGNGMLVDFAKGRGFDAVGYDLYRPETHDALNSKYDCLLLIEVIEHLSEPFDELKLIKNLLNPGGKVMIETSFSDWLTEHDAYIEPKVGHCTIFSHAGLDFLFEKFGFKIGKHINDNVRIYAVG